MHRLYILRERCQIRISDAVLVGQAFGVGGQFLVGNVVGAVIAFGWRYFQIFNIFTTFGACQFQGYLVVFAYIDFSVAVFAVLAGPNQQVAQARGYGGLAVGVGGHGGEGVVFGVVVEFEFHLRVFQRIAVLVLHCGCDMAGVGVVAEQVQFAVKSGAAHYLLVAFVAAESLGMHHHTACGWNGKPRHVEFGVGLAGTEIVPLAVHPYLHPCVVVVGVCPARGVALSGGDAHGAQCRNQKRGFLATASVAGAYGGQRRGGAYVAGTVGHFFVAPVVNLQSCIVHLHPFHSVFQFVEDKHAGGVEVFVVHTIDKHEMAEHILRHRASPRKGVAGGKGIAHLLEEESAVVVGQIAVGHVGVEELHGLRLFERQGGVHHREKLLGTAFGKGFAGFEVLLHLRMIVGIGDEMRLVMAGYHNNGRRQTDNSREYLSETIKYH